MLIKFHNVRMHRRYRMCSVLLIVSCAKRKHTHTQQVVTSQATKRFHFCLFIRLSQFIVVCERHWRGRRCLLLFLVLYNLFRFIVCHFPTMIRRRSSTDLGWYAYTLCVFVLVWIVFCTCKCLDLYAFEPTWCRCQFLYVVFCSISLSLCLFLFIKKSTDTQTHSCTHLFHSFIIRILVFVSNFSIAIHQGKLNENKSKRNKNRHARKIFFFIL